MFVSLHRCVACASVPPLYHWRNNQLKHDIKVRNEVPYTVGHKYIIFIDISHFIADPRYKTRERLMLLLSDNNFILLKGQCSTLEV